MTNARERLTMRTKGRSPGERPAPGCPEQRTQSHPGGLRGPRASPANPGLPCSEVRGKADGVRRGPAPPGLLHRCGRAECRGHPALPSLQIPLQALLARSPQSPLPAPDPWDTVSKTRVDPLNLALLDAFQKKSQVMGGGSLPVLCR